MFSTSVMSPSLAVEMDVMRERAFALPGRALQRGRGGGSSRLCGYTLLNFYNPFLPVLLAVTKRANVWNPSRRPVQPPRSFVLNPWRYFSGLFVYRGRCLTIARQRYAAGIYCLASEAVVSELFGLVRAIIRPLFICLARCNMPIWPRISGGKVSQRKEIVSQWFRSRVLL